MELMMVFTCLLFKVYSTRMCTSVHFTALIQIESRVSIVLDFEKEERGFHLHKSLYIVS